MTLQIFYKIREEKNRHAHSHPDLSKLRSGLFWDTDIKKIDWNRHQRAVVERIYERGNAREKAEIKRFYGDQVVNKILKKTECLHG